MVEKSFAYRQPMCILVHAKVREGDMTIKLNHDLTIVENLLFQ